MGSRDRTLFLVRFGLLLAIEALFCFTPLGSLPAIGPIVATLAMIPVVITAIVLGTWAGSLMGLFAGIFSLIVWSFMPPSPIVAFVFSPLQSGNVLSAVICIVPRVLVGTASGLFYRAFRRRRDWLRYGVAGAVGSLTNTLLVMGGIALVFGGEYASALGVGLFTIIATTVLTSGIPEAVVTFIVAYAVCRPLKKDVERRR